MKLDAVLIKLKDYCSPEYFSSEARGYATPAELRDRNIEVVHNLMGDFFGELRNLAIEENKRREGLPEKYIKCVRCKGYHDQLKNIDGLCERCEQLTAPFRYDKTHAADPSVEPL